MLAYGVMDDAPVPAQYAAGGVEIVAWLRGFAGVTLYGGGIVAVGDEADILTVGLSGV